MTDPCTAIRSYSSAAVQLVPAVDATIGEDSEDPVHARPRLRVGPALPLASPASKAAPMAGASKQSNQPGAFSGVRDHRRAAPCRASPTRPASSSVKHTRNRKGRCVGVDALRTSPGCQRQHLARQGGDEQIGTLDRGVIGAGLEPPLCAAAKIAVMPRMPRTSQRPEVTRGPPPAPSRLHRRRGRHRRTVSPMPARDRYRPAVRSPRSRRAHRAG
jgi:hypothetical protein